MTARRPSFKHLARAAVVASIALIGLTLPDVDDAEAKPSNKQSSKSCNPQKPQSSLIRKAWLPRAGATAKDVKRRQSAHQKAVRYRIEHYGYVDGFGSKDWNPHPPTYYGEDTTFFGIGLRMHKRVVPALSCVEKEIRKSCKSTPYTPKGYSTYRDHNTYRGGEITNHLFGIALDIDSERNPCCGCVDPWPDNPRCQDKKKSVYDRMDMPKCWVDSFEKYGFYWLGHDQLEDTMHFEFLGDPDKIMR